MTADRPDAGSPTGSVSFFDWTNGASLGTAALAAGIATLDVLPLAVGNHTIVAAYSGDADFMSSATAIGPGTTIMTIAGNGTAGYSGDGVQATHASLNYPIDVAVDDAGHLFIADSRNGRVRQVDMASGVITTVAGTGTLGFSGDGGPAVAAELNYPSGLAVDDAGHLFIADLLNVRVRQVDLATGMITTVAGDGTLGYGGDGGPATAAKISYPGSLAIDATGHLYIADGGNNRVRQVDLASGLITTVAGNGSEGFSGDAGPATEARLSRSLDVAVDGAGHLYIGDGGNNRVRQVDLSAGQITTIAGNGTAGYDGDGGPALSASLSPGCISVGASGRLLVADLAHNVVRQVDLVTGWISTVAGDGTLGYSGDGGPATEAQLNSPLGLAVDAAGQLFIAEIDNNAVRRVDLTTGLITTAAGGYNGDGGAATSAPLNRPAGLAGEGGRRVFIAEPDNDVIRELDLATGVITRAAGGGPLVGDGGPATQAELGNPNAVAVDGAGHLFIAGYFQDRVRRVDLATGVITTVAGNGTSGFSGDGGPATAAQLNQPDGVAVDGDGRVFIADYNNNRVRMVDPATGIITTVAGNGTWIYSGDGGPATQAGMRGPVGLAVDANDHLFIADVNAQRIRMVDLATGVITTVAGNGTAGYGGDGGPATEAMISNPQGVAVDGRGQLYIADWGNQRIRQVDLATGVITTIAGNGTASYAGDGGPAGAAALHGPQSVWVDGAGSLYIGDSDNHRIRRLASGVEVAVSQAAPSLTVQRADGVYAGQSFVATALVAGVVAGVDTTPAASLEGVSPTVTYFVGPTATGGGSAVPPSAPGTYTVVASFAGSANYAAVQSAPVTFVIAKAVPTLTLQASGGTYNGVPFRATALLTGVVSGVDDLPASSLEGVLPTVSYYVGSSVTGPGSHDPPAEAGTYTVAASFPGSLDYVAVDGQPVTFSIAKSTPTVRVTQAGGTYNGQPAPVTGEADFVAARPEVVEFLYTFYAGAGTSGTKLVAAPTAVGTYTVVVTFAGSANYTAADSPPFTFTIDKATPGITVRAAGGTYNGASFPASAVLTFPGPPPQNPSVAYTYYAGSSPSGTGSSTAPVAAGTYTAVASLAGSANYAAAVSAPVIFTIGKATPTVTAVSRNGVYNGKPLAATTTIAGVVPNVDTYPSSQLEGVRPRLTYYVGTSPGGSGSTAPPVDVGTYTVVASFSGSGNYAAGQSPPVTFSIAKPMPRVAVTASADAVVSGQSVAITATITAVQQGTAAPTGTVDFYDWTTHTSLGSVGLSGGSATLFTSALAMGTHNITARYSGDEHFGAAASVADGGSIITTIAGNASRGFSGDGGQATDAALYWPGGLAVDDAGSLFFTDSGNQRIRKVDLATSVITTIAGDGTKGYGGDGGDAAHAQLDSPASVVLDGTGQLYFADRNNYCVRRIDLATGVITTVAGNGTSGYSGDGGSATAAQIGFPQSLVLAAGRLFIADYIQNVVRAVDLTSGVISTFAGTGTAGSSGDGGPAGSARLTMPVALATDGAGHLFIGEVAGPVRRVDLSTSLITTVYPLRPSGLAADAAGHLFVSDSLNNVINELNLATNESAHVAGWGAATSGYTGDGGPAGNAQLYSPSSIALDAAGNLYLADLNDVIRRIDSGVRVRVVPAPTQPVRTGLALELAADPPSPLVFGQPLSFTATVTALEPSLDTPTGTVDFFDMQTRTALGSAAVSGGVAVLHTATVPVGTHVITATYSGDANFLASTLQIGRSSTITLLAGNGNAGYGGDGGPAAAGLLSNPQDVAADATGHVFVADTGNHRIREIDLATGLMTTVAGAGIAGDGGDGAAADAAALSSPHGVAVDNAGHLYIADTGNHRVRRVDLATGIITTVAGTGVSGFGGDGGPAAAAQLNSPWDVAVDAAGRLFIADSSNSRIRQVDLASGVISTLAGNGTNGYGGDGGPATAAALYLPEYLALDTSGHMFIADTYNMRIRSVDLATGVITKVAGNGKDVSGNGPTGINNDGSRAVLATLNYPRGVAVDEAGNLFLADFVDHRIGAYTYAYNPVVRRVDASTGLVQTIAGTVSDGYAGDRGQAGAALLNRPLGIALDGDGNLFIADSSNNRVREIVNGIRLTIRPSGSTPTDLALAASARSLVFGQPVTLTATVTPLACTTASLAGTVEFFDGGASLGSVPLVDGLATLRTSALGMGSHTMTARYAGTAEFQASQTTIDAGSTITTVAGNGGYYSSTGDGGQATEAVLGQPSAVAVDALGQVFIVNSGSNRIRQVNLATGIITAAAGNGTQAYGGDGGPANAAQLDSPSAVAVDDAGHLYIADTGNHRIRAVDLASGLISTVAGNGTDGYSGDGGQAIQAALSTVGGIAVSAGFLFLADSANHVIRQVDLATGVISTLAGTGSAGYGGDGGPAAEAFLSTPWTLALDGLGHLFVADTGNGRVRQVDLATGTITTVAGGGSNSPGDGGQATAARIDTLAGLAADTAGNVFFVDQGLMDPMDPEASSWSSVVRRVSRATGVITTVAGNGTAGLGGDGGSATAAALNYPTGLAVTSSGRLLIADTGNGRVRQVDFVADVITTVAGGGTDDGGQAVDVALPYAGAITTDASGRLFVGDGSRVRQVDLATGVITTIAGTGVSGFSGDGGPATAAQLSHAAGLAVDGGYLYIADAQNARIRRVDLSTGVIATFAGTGVQGYSGDGGPALAARLSDVGSLAVDGAGHLFLRTGWSYVNPGYNDRVRMIDLATGLITTVAGSGLYGYTGDGGPATAAAMAGSGGDPRVEIAVDGTGHLFVAGWGVIRQVDLPTGMISTLAGNAGAGFGGDGGPADEATIGTAMAQGLAVGAGRLYLSDGKSRIREIELSTGVIRTVAGAGTAGYAGDGGSAGAAQLSAPSHASLDPAGNLFFLDAGRVRRIDNGLRVVVQESGGITIPVVTVSAAGGTYSGLPFAATAWVTGSDGVPAASLDGVSPSVTYYVGPTASGTASAAPPVAAGTYTAVAAFPGSSRYAAAESVPVTFSIAPRPLTITADDKTKVYWTPVPVLTASYRGLVAGDSPASLTTQPTLTTTATSNSQAGRYEITVSGAAAANYTIDHVSGTLTVVSSGWQNPLNACDVSGDGPVSAGDALAVINYINGHPGNALPPPAPAIPPPFYDVNGDDRITPNDVLMVVNYINSHLWGSGEGEAVPSLAAALGPRSWRSFHRSLLAVLPAAAVPSPSPVSDRVHSEPAIGQPRLCLEPEPTEFQSAPPAPTTAWPDSHCGRARQILATDEVDGVFAGWDAFRSDVAEDALPGWEQVANNRKVDN